MIDTLHNSENIYTIETHEETLKSTIMGRLSNLLTRTDPKDVQHAEYLSNQRKITITPGVRAKVFNFSTKQDAIIPHSGVLAHELGHAFVHETTGVGRGIRGGQTEPEIHRLVDNPQQGFVRGTSGTFLPSEK